MMDEFMAELFGPPGRPASFNDRFAGAPMPVRPLAGPVGTPASGAPMAPPSPGIEAILSGGALPKPGGAPGPARPGPTMRDLLPPQAAPKAGMAPADLLRLLSGGGGGAMAKAAPRAEGAEEEGLLDILGGKGFRSSLAGGLSDGDRRFKGGAFSRGFGRALAGGLKSERDDEASSIKADETEYKRGQDARKLALDERRVSNSEKTGAAQRTLYGARTKAVSEDRPSTAWNKPAGERWKDAQKLIMDFNEQVDRAAKLAGSGQDPEAQRSQARALKDQFKRNTLQKYGFDDNGKELSSSDKVMGDHKAGAMGLTFDDPHTPANMDDFAKIKTGQYYINPADGEVYIKNNGEQP